MEEYKFDRTVFRKMNIEEAEQAKCFDKTLPIGERLRQAYYLTLQACGYSVNDQPRLDRTFFTCRKLGA